jgi:hypothetical protein
MSDHSDDDRTAGPGIQSPIRPTWVVVLTSLMLLFAAQLFFTALTTLRSLRAPAPIVDASLSTPEDALVREIGAASAALDRAHPAAVRAHAFARLALALMLFYVVAAVFSYDRRGRAAALLAGWLGILYHVGNALFFIFVVRQSLLAMAPAWANVMLKQGGAMKDMSGEDLIGIADTMTLVVPVALAAAGIAFCIVLLAFFGGSKGRTFYGVRAHDTRLPDNGG